MVNLCVYPRASSISRYVMAVTRFVMLLSQKQSDSLKVNSIKAAYGEKVNWALRFSLSCTAQCNLADETLS
jgi:hypothetical protein